MPAERSTAVRLLPMGAVARGGRGRARTTPRLTGVATTAGSRSVSFTRRLVLTTIPWLAMTWGAAATAVPSSPPPAPGSAPASTPAPATAVSSASPRRSAGDDDAALLAYHLVSISRLDDGHRYLNLGQEQTKHVVCRADYSCAITTLRVAMNRAEILAGRTTRLTLIWSAYQKGVSELEVRLAANGEQRIDWLRPSASTGGAGRRLTLDVPALAVRRAGGLAIRISLAKRKAGKGAYADHFIDGLELELLP